MSLLPAFRLLSFVPRSMPRRIARAFIAFTLIAVTACTATEATIQLGGSLSVFPAEPPLDVDDLPDDWISRGDIPPGHVAASTKLGTTTLFIRSAREPFMLARRVRANLLATPYLSWRWQVEPGKWHDHPARIVVGFASDPGRTAQGDVIARLFPASAFPEYDRVISLVWAPSALMRGTLAPLDSGGSPVLEARYSVRGGTENVARWWSETVDLASLYKQAWPSDRLAQVRIAFIGLSAAASDTGAAAYLSGLRLSR